MPEKGQSIFGEYTLEDEERDHARVLRRLTEEFHNYFDKEEITAEFEKARAAYADKQSVRRHVHIFTEKMTRRELRRKVAEMGGQNVSEVRD